MPGSTATPTLSSRASSAGYGAAGEAPPRVTELDAQVDGEGDCSLLPASLEYRPDFTEYEEKVLDAYRNAEILGLKEVSVEVNVNLLDKFDKLSKRF